MLTPRFIKVFPALVSFMMATAMFIQMKAWTVSDDPAEFHASVRASAQAIPARFNNWEGTEIPVPAPAAKLLRPNVLFARRYENESTQRVANLVLIHCTDSRDMSGHYPPNCYPATGWTPDGATEIEKVTLGKRTIPVVIYKFARTEPSSSRHSVVYNFFILPSGLATSMDDVHAAAGDRRSRPYGAAQIQIIMEAGVPKDRQIQIVEELLQPLASIIDTLQIRKEGNRS